MSTASLRWLVFALATFLLVSFAGSAHAQALARAKDAGYVGEKRDGTVAVIEGSNPPDAVQALVGRVNAQRKESYAALAKRRGKDPAVVGSRAASKLFLTLRPGQHYEAEDGTWKKKTKDAPAK